MGALLFNTQYNYPGFRNAVEDTGIPVARVFHETKYPSDPKWVNHLYVNILGRNDGKFKTGMVVTVKTPTSTFSGPIWYIYQGATSYNLYVQNINAPRIADANSGTVYIGTSVPVATPKATEVAKEAVVQAIKSNEEITAEVGPKTTAVVTAVAKKGAPWAVLALIAAAIIAYTYKKGKKKGK